MFALDLQPQKPQLSQVGDRLAVAVAWEQADDLHNFLRARGIRSTQHLEPAARTAHLELWDKIDPRRLQDLLDEWEGRRPPRRRYARAA